jgi:hypothetical protein
LGRLALLLVLKKKKGMATKSTYVESAFIDEEQVLSGRFDFFLFFWGPCKLGFGV